MAWKMYLGNGDTFDSTQGSPTDAPGSDVVCIMQSSTMLGREILYRWPCYWWDGTRWRSGTFDDVFDRHLAGLTVGSYCEGVVLDAVATRSIWETAFGDTALGVAPKTARDGNESPFDKEPDYVTQRIILDRTLTPDPVEPG